jgi:protocatechuate 3,4-dioxygenase beta subunit
MATDARAEALTRRDLLLKCAAMGVLTVAPGVSMAEALAWGDPQGGSARAATAWNEIGPFYKRAAPHLAHLRAPGDPGLPLSVSGQILDTRGQALQGATIEIWHADDAGLYDLDGYRYRTSLVADRTGQYAFDSIMPGHYPGRVCQHVHYLVKAEGCKPLTTQLYFATDPVFAGDPAHNYAKDPLVQSVELVRPVTMTKTATGNAAAVTFEIVLERL